MSWLTSIANSLNPHDTDDDEESEPESTSSQETLPQNPNNGGDGDQSIHNSPLRGVKEDLSELSKTLTNQFWGVTSFLASPSQFSDSGDSNPTPVGITGIRNDLSEIGGRFRTGISKLSSNKAVSEFSKIASNLLQFGSEDEGVVGVTHEVVAFARDVALHPKTWIDFPLPNDDDFDLSDAQQEHALAVECLAPELAALRVELCLGYMNEAVFWKIYFVLVHPKLSKHDAEILCTPEIVRARALLAQELLSHDKPGQSKLQTGDVSADTTKLSHEEHLPVPVIDQFDSVPVEISAVELASSFEVDVEMDKHPVITTEIPFIDKIVVKEVSLKQINIEEATCSTSEGVADEMDADDWLRDEIIEGGVVMGTSHPGENADDISFSDLEEDEEIPTNFKQLGLQNDKVGGDTLKKESSDWRDIDIV